MSAKAQTARQKPGSHLRLATERSRAFYVVADTWLVGVIVSEGVRGCQVVRFLSRYRLHASALLIGSSPCLGLCHALPVDSLHVLRHALHL